jgi:hypothetical protein
MEAECPCKRLVPCTRLQSVIFELILLQTRKNFYSNGRTLILHLFTKRVLLLAIVFRHATVTYKIPLPSLPPFTDEINGVHHQDSVLAI